MLNALYNRPARGRRALGEEEPDSASTLVRFVTKTLRMPPAFKTGVAKDVRTYEQLVELVARDGEV